ncbi:MAG: hypothetical protein WHT08_02570 [Bryobacteraceae bacterium]
MTLAERLARKQRGPGASAGGTQEKALQEQRETRGPGASAGGTQKKAPQEQRKQRVPGASGIAKEFDLCAIAIRCVRQKI